MIHQSLTFYSPRDVLTPENLDVLTKGFVCRLRSFFHSVVRFSLTIHHTSQYLPNLWCLFLLEHKNLRAQRRRRCGTNAGCLKEFEQHERASCSAAESFSDDTVFNRRKCTSLASDDSARSPEHRGLQGTTCPTSVRALVDNATVFQIVWPKISRSIFGNLFLLQYREPHHFFLRNRHC